MKKKKEFITTEYNLKLINKYAKNIDTGLFLLPSPTGSGKTHAIIKFIIENLERGQKIVYAVPNHTNLDDFETKLYLELDSKQRDKIFKLRNTTSQLENWYENKSNQNYTLLSEYEDFKNIKKTLEILNALKKDVSVKGNYKDLIEEQKNKIRVYSNRLIELVKNKINKDSSNKKEYTNIGFSTNNISKEDKILKDELIDVFPFLEISKYSVILTTASKLVYKIKQFNASKYLWDIDKFKNSYIFLDEFDSHKKYYLDTIINSSKEKDIDIVELFRIIAKTFSNSKFDIKLNHDLTKFQEVKSRVINIFNRYSLMYYIDTELIAENSSLPILIDSSFKGLNLQKNASELYVKVDNKSQHLLIIDKKEEGDFLLSELINDIKNSIDSYVYLVKNIVLEQSKLVKDKNLGETLLHARIKDNIKIFDISEEDLKYTYLFNRIIDDIDRNEYIKGNRFNFNWGLYEKGFSLINIQKKHLKSELTEISSYSLNNSPEKLLVNMCSKAVVIGVSATAQIETVVKNFDLKYLAYKIDLFKPSSDEIIKMQEYYLDSKNQRNRVFNISTLNNIATNNMNDDILISFIKRNFESNLTLYESIKEKNIDKFILSRYMNFIDIYRIFLLEDKIDSFLYFSNNYFLKDDSAEYAFVIELLVQMINNLDSINETIVNLKNEIKQKNKNLLKECKKNSIFYFVYNGENEDKYKDYIEENSNRKKFVLAVYSNIGTGKSLEYKKNGIKKDFDAIYLEKPTYVINKKAITKNEKIRIIYDLKSILESHQIIYKDFIKEVKSSFTSIEHNTSVYYLTKDHNEAIMQVIIQALGRVHRTNNTTDVYFCT